jgi:mRNA-degrading endonuclease RelE of RelBE toxin-antitoxin system
LSKATAKTRSGHDTPTRTRIWIAIEAIPNGDIKVMQGHDDLFRLKGGKYRVFVANVKRDGKDVVAVNDIGARGDIYKS